MTFSTERNTFGTVEVVDLKVGFAHFSLYDIIHLNT